MSNGMGDKLSRQGFSFARHIAMGLIAVISVLLVALFCWLLVYGPIVLTAALGSGLWMGVYGLYLLYGLYWLGRWMDDDCH